MTSKSCWSVMNLWCQWAESPLLTAVWWTAFLELPSTATDCLQDLKGKFILLRNESKPLMGQVFHMVGDEVEVIYMQQLGGKNVFYLASFTWPPIPLQVWCAAHNIWAPEPLSLFHSKLVTGSSSKHTHRPTVTFTYFRQDSDLIANKFKHTRGSKRTWFPFNLSPLHKYTHTLFWRCNFALICFFLNCNYKTRHESTVYHYDDFLLSDIVT